MTGSRSLKAQTLVLGFMALLWASESRCLDLPFDIGFQLGFKTTVVSGPKDMSDDLGLVVAIHRVLTDRVSSLTVTGSITNFSNLPRNCLDMRFAVTSYVSTSTSKGRAIIEPDSLPPGSTATFRAYISLDYDMPQFVRYTITADGSCP